MPRLSKLIEKIEDRLANKWGCWYERNKARVPLYAVLGGIGWYLYGMFLNSLKLGKESVFNTTGEVIESIWVFNPFKNLFAVFTPFGLGVSAFIALMVCLITKKGYSWFSGYLNKGYAICNKCGAVMDRKEDPEGGCGIYACPSCGWEIEELDYEYESADEMELGLDERGDEYLIFRDDMPPAGCKACGGPYPYCKASCKMFDD